MTCTHLRAMRVLLAALAAGVAQAACAEPLLIRARSVHTVQGPVLRPGAVLVLDGKIEAVGPELEAPAGSRIVDVDTLIPGLVDAYSQAGLSGGDSEFTLEVTPTFDTALSLDRHSRSFREVLDQGVTTANVVPGSENVIAGLSVAIKTAPKNRTVSSGAALLISVCSDPARRNNSRSRPDSIFIRQPTNRMGVVWILRHQFHEALGVLPPSALGEDGNESDTSAAEGLPHRELGLLRESLQGARPILGLCRAKHDIETLLNLGEEFGFRPLIVGGDESYELADRLAANQAPVIYTALTTGSLVGSEGTELRWNVPGKLHAGGVPIALAGGRLLEQARFAARFGLDGDAALAAVTRVPAQILRIEDRVGSLGPGRDADLVAIRGDPLEFTSQVEWVMVDGQFVSGSAPLESEDQ